MYYSNLYTYIPIQAYPGASIYKQLKCIFFFSLSLFCMCIPLTTSVGKGVPNIPISIPKKIKQHSNPIEKDMRAENDLPPYLVSVALHPISNHEYKNTKTNTKCFCYT